MSVPVPFPRAFVLLGLAVPGVWLLGRALAHRVAQGRATRGPLAAGIAVSLAVLGVHLASLAFGSVWVGLPVGLVALAAAGVAAEVARRRRAGSGSAEGRAPSAWMFVTMVAATAALAPVALGYHLHDELYLTGHMSIAAQIQNGVYPPRHLAFPDVPLRYHYGFDLVAAALTALVHVPVDRAIDVATLGLFALSWALLWALGERLLGRGHAWVVPVCALFAGGLPVACDNAQPSLVGRVVDMCQIGRHYVNPPVPVYFFQHPWSLGLPVGVTALLVVTARRASAAAGEPAPESPGEGERPAAPGARGEPDERVRLAVLAAVLGALSMSQMTLFAALLPAFVVAEAWGEGRVHPGRALRMLAVVGAAGALAKVSGGFLVSTPDMRGLAFVPQAGFGATLGETARWNAQTFGALLPLGVAGLLAMRRDRLLFGLLALGALVVVNTLRYEGTDDILKFATLASLALAVLSSGALARWLPSRFALAEIVRWKPAAALACVGAITLSGAVFVGALGAGWRGVPGWMRAGPSPVAAADAEVIAWLRGRIRAGEGVYRAEVHGLGYAQWGGLPQPWIQWTVKAFGFTDDRIARREHLLRAPPEEPGAYLREGFRYLVLDGSPQDRPLRAAAEAWIARGEARRAKETGPLLVVDLAAVP